MSVCVGVQGVVGSYHSLINVGGCKIQFLLDSESLSVYSAFLAWVVLPGQRYLGGSREVFG